MSNRQSVDQRQESLNRRTPSAPKKTTGKEKLNHSKQEIDQNSSQFGRRAKERDESRIRKRYVVTLPRYRVYETISHLHFRRRVGGYYLTPPCCCLAIGAIITALVLLGAVFAAVGITGL